MPSPKLAPLLLSDTERRSRKAPVRRRTASQSLALGARIVLACALQLPLLRLHREGPAGVTEGSGRRSFQGGPDHRRTSRGRVPGEFRERWRSNIRLMERFADARSHPMQPCATIALVVGVPRFSDDAPAGDPRCRGPHPGGPCRSARPTGRRSGHAHRARSGGDSDRDGLDSASAAASDRLGGPSCQLVGSSGRRGKGQGVGLCLMRSQ
jgi:hypothetical protein